MKIECLLLLISATFAKRPRFAAKQTKGEAGQQRISSIFVRRNSISFRMNEGHSQDRVLMCLMLCCFFVFFMSHCLIICFNGRALHSKMQSTEQPCELANSYNFPTWLSFWLMAHYLPRLGVQCLKHEKLLMQYPAAVWIFYAVPHCGVPPHQPN